MKVTDARCKHEDSVQDIKVLGIRTVMFRVTSSISEKRKDKSQ